MTEHYGGVLSIYPTRLSGIRLGCSC